MIPPILAKQLQQGIKEYLYTTYPITNEPFKSSFNRFINDDGGLYIEPYTSIKLPFRSTGTVPTCFEAVEAKFIPYVHQQKAFDRLVGDDGQSTLIATGTGSGKTECFLYPILEYCYQHREQRGVKALIIYPMNALASDQAGRMAKEIWNSSKLKDNVRVGLYVGGSGHSGSKIMTENSVITNRDTMQSNPPDILLTNYKMLDYLLVRPGYTGIWANGADNALRYVVVDEFHTFDGAQGTDLACLLRRLKSRLSIQRGQLCCIGTSATMGGEDSKETILKYAHDIFGEEFDKDALITEDRLSVDEFLDGYEYTSDALINANAETSLLQAFNENDEKAYLQTALDSCTHELAGRNVNDLDVRLSIGKALLGNLLFRDIMQFTKGGYFQPSIVAEELKNRHTWLAELTHPEVAVDAIVSLVSHARVLDSNGNTAPFLHVQTQMWERELARFTAQVAAENVHFDISLNLSDTQRKHHMLLFNCHDCGQTAWISTMDPNQNMRTDGLNAFYNEFFGAGRNIVVAYPGTNKLDISELSSGWLCPSCMHVDLPVPDEKGAHHCKECETECISVLFGSLDRARKSSSTQKQYVCPCCGSERGGSLIGLRNATQSEVSITQMFGSSFNDDNKTLLFNDNVQDASHRAGFLNSRAYRFGLRSAFAEYLAHGGSELTLDSFANGVVCYYKDSNRLKIEEFVARFLGPNNFWMRAYVAMLERDKLGINSDAETLVQNACNRLRYEVLLEFGMRRSIGRSLGKSLVADIAFEQRAVEQACAIIRELCENELGILLSFQNAKELLLAFLNLLRDEGAIVDTVFEKFAQEGANSYFLTNSFTHYLPGNNIHNTPKFLLDSNATKKGFLHISSTSCKNLVGFILPEHFLEAIPIMDCVKRSAVKSGLLGYLVEEGRNSCLGLMQDKMVVTNRVLRLTCDVCGAGIPLAEQNYSGLNKLHCLRAGCNGFLHPDTNQNLDYYGTLFNKGLVDRVEAQEHTGLLNREEREELERRFKATDDTRQAWYPNVLSCTPTLEMGIDIGDLSSLVLCGMPPGQAQFQQRAGRAGRHDGNAFCAVLADASPHGMYFYGDPLEMMQGEVEPPHVFLHTPAVLERQFIAFCMDRWIIDMKDAAFVPDHMRSCLAYMTPGKEDAKKYPRNFLHYVKSHIRTLTSTFLNMFSEDLADDEITKDSLRNFAMGENGSVPMSIRILSAFQQRYDFRESYRQQQKELKNQIKNLESLPTDKSFEKQIKELKVELFAVSDVIKSIDKEDVFGFLSCSGLLPNYAFPEEGISLRTVIRRRQENDGALKKSKFEYESHEYSRSASSAISEFAPGNVFYANSRHFEVDQVDMATSKTELWRLCPNCSHGELITPATPSANCPKCGHAGWADSGQVMSMIKLQTVISNVDDTMSLTDDSSERRVRRFFSKQMMVEVDESSDVEAAWHISGDQFDFGFEFDRRATLREVNFGQSSIDPGHEISVAGQSFVRPGFRVCSKCGRIEKEVRGSKKIDHALSCPVRTNDMSEDDAVLNCMFLYREFHSEAFRILIPETTFAGDESSIVDSFIASIMLGLRKKFGNVDHLLVTIQDEPIGDTGYRKRYLVIYDSVPGGTGYLKQLAGDSETFLDVLRLAKQAMDTCSCNKDVARDGCYHCLYAYRISRDMDHVSKRIAQNVLAQILDPSNSTESVSSVARVDVNNLFGSELERMFIDTLSAMKSASEEPATCSPEFVNGKKGYRLALGDVVWEIEPQVNLGPEQGVSVYCCPDFVMYPIVATGHDCPWKPVAVFTDGFEYHKNEMADDTCKRAAIARSGKYRVWSITWRDVETATQSTQDYYLNCLKIPELPREDLRAQALQAKGGAGSFEPKDLSSFWMLQWYLAHPEAEEMFKRQAVAYGIGMLEADPPDKARFNEWNQMVGDVAYQMSLSKLQDAFKYGSSFVNIWAPSEAEYVRIYAGVSQTDASSTGEPSCIIAFIDDTQWDDTVYQSEWNGFLHLSNLMQFFDGYAAVSKEGLEQNRYLELSDVVDISVVVYSEKFTDEWRNIASELFDENSKKFVDRLCNLKMPLPDEVGFELTNGEMAEIAWIDCKVCYLMEAQLEDADAFFNDGWTVLTDESADAEILKCFGE